MDISYRIEPFFKYKNESGNCTGRTERDLVYRVGSFPWEKTWETDISAVRRTISGPRREPSREPSANLVYRMGSFPWEKTWETDILAVRRTISGPRREPSREPSATFVPDGLVSLGKNLGIRHFGGPSDHLGASPRTEPRTEREPCTG